LFGIPLIGGGEFAVQTTLGFGFVIDRVEAYDSLEEDVKFRVSLWVLSNFEEGLEDVCPEETSLAEERGEGERECVTFDKVVEGLYDFRFFVDIVETRDLDQPSHIM
jgi:hypothetical protein